MYIDEYRNYCLTKPGVTESFPFNEVVLVFKVMGKMFALTDVDEFASINLKCEPARAIELREKYSAVVPGYHMNKSNWNTIMMDDSIPDALLREWIDDSYDLIVQGLKKKLQEELTLLRRQQ